MCRKHTFAAAQYRELMTFGIDIDKPDPVRRRLLRKQNPVEGDCFDRICHTICRLRAGVKAVRPFEPAQSMADRTIGNWHAQRCSAGMIGNRFGNDLAVTRHDLGQMRGTFGVRLESNDFSRVAGQYGCEQSDIGSDIDGDLVGREELPRGYHLPFMRPQHGMADHAISVNHLWWQRLSDHFSQIHHHRHKILLKPVTTLSGDVWTQLVVDAYYPV